MPALTHRHARLRHVLPLLVLALTATACSADTAPPPGTPDVKFDTTAMTLKDKPFTIEIADTETKTSRGLMYRAAMPADHGMLFILAPGQEAKFWMHNTLIPLDIIFLDPTGKVIEIDHRRALDETSSGPDQPAPFVIELNAGTAEAIGLKLGDTVTLPEKYLKKNPANSEKKP